MYTVSCCVYHRQDASAHAHAESKADSKTRMQVSRAHVAHAESTADSKTRMQVSRAHAESRQTVRRRLLAVRKVYGSTGTTPNSHSVVVFTLAAVMLASTSA